MSVLLKKRALTTKKTAGGGGGGGGSQARRFVIDCSAPVGDAILDIAGFEKYLHDRIKINGKTGQLGSSVAITRDKARLVVTADIPLSKRYLKYLSKRYLKKQQLRDWLRVIATDKHTYTLKYFNIRDEGEEGEEGDEEAEDEDDENDEE